MTRSCSRLLDWSETTVLRALACAEERELIRGSRLELKRNLRTGITVWEASGNWLTNTSISNLDPQRWEVLNMPTTGLRCWQPSMTHSALSIHWKRVACFTSQDKWTPSITLRMKDRCLITTRKALWTSPFSSISRAAGRLLEQLESLKKTFLAEKRWVKMMKANRISSGLTAVTWDGLAPRRSRKRKRAWTKWSQGMQNKQRLRRLGNRWAPWCLKIPNNSKIWTPPTCKYRWLIWIDPSQQTWLRSGKWHQGPESMNKVPMEPSPDQ